MRPGVTWLVFRLELHPSTTFRKKRGTPLRVLALFRDLLIRIKMSTSSTFFRRSAPVVLVISLFVLYLFSMAPGLTWAHDGADGGDLITAAATGGVAHPS